MDGKYSIELCNEGGPDARIEAELAREDNLATARRLYRLMAAQYVQRIIVLRDRGTIIARSDEPDTMSL